MEIAGLVLAAGAGRRYGMPKALVRHGEGRLAEHAAGVLAAGGCVPVLVVIGAEAARVRAAAPALSYVDNPDWPTGMGSSLRAGLAALAATPAEAAVVLLVDMPGVTPDAVRRVAAHAGRDALVAAGYGGRRGHPVLLGRDHWPGVIASATGDRGARDYLRAHPPVVVEVGDVADDTDRDVPPPDGPLRHEPAAHPGRETRPEPAARPARTPEPEPATQPARIPDPAPATQPGQGTEPNAPAQPGQGTEPNAPAQPGQGTEPNAPARPGRVPAAGSAARRSPVVRDA